MRANCQQAWLQACRLVENDVEDVPILDMECGPQSPIAEPFRMGADPLLESILEFSFLLLADLRLGLRAQEPFERYVDGVEQMKLGVRCNRGGAFERAPGRG